MPFFNAPVLLTSLPSEMSILSHFDMFALSLQTIKKKTLSNNNDFYFY